MKEKKKNKNLSIITKPNDHPDTLVTDVNKLPPVPAGVSAKGIAKALTAINNSNRAEVEATRQKLKDSL